MESHNNGQFCVYPALPTTTTAPTIAITKTDVVCVMLESQMGKKAKTRWNDNNSSINSGRKWPCAFHIRIEHTLTHTLKMNRDRGNENRNGHIAMTKKRNQISLKASST